MHTYVHSITIHNSKAKKQLKSTDEWIKMWYICTMEYYSARKKKK